MLHQNGSAVALAIQETIRITPAWIEAAVAAMAEERKNTAVPNQTHPIKKAPVAKPLNANYVVPTPAKHPIAMATVTATVTATATATIHPTNPIAGVGAAVTSSRTRWTIWTVRPIPTSPTGQPQQQ